MAEKIVSPGAYLRENDQSFLTPQLQIGGAAIVGPTVKGPALVPTTVSSYSQYETIFGSSFKSGSDYYQYLTSYAAKEYFNNGGNTLLVTRILSGSYSNATSSVASLGGSISFKLNTISDGDILNNSAGTEVSGALASGSADNIRWEISNNNTATGTFSLLVRRGDDTIRNKIILETWTNLSLDPNAGNFISRVIGDSDNVYNSSGAYISYTGSYQNKSNYVYVSNVNTTPDYFDNNGLFKAQYTSSLPATGSGSFSQGSNGTVSSPQYFGQSITDSSTNSQGYIGASYIDALNLLADKDIYDFNLLLLPGIVAGNSNLSSAVDAAITLAENRGDCFVILDPNGFGASVSSAISQGQSKDTNYAAYYWPWTKILDSKLNKQVWVPSSVVTLGAYAFNDEVAAEWWAPAGFNRASLGAVLQTERNLPKSDRDNLYENGSINPIVSFPGLGITIFGQKTLQRKASALDRVNVRRLLINLKKHVSNVSKLVLFEQNTTATRNKLYNLINPYLESIIQRQGLYDAKVVIDENNNNADVIDRNQLVGQIYLKPTRTAEYIIVDFNVMPSGVSFPV